MSTTLTREEIELAFEKAFPEGAVIIDSGNDQSVDNFWIDFKTYGVLETVHFKRSEGFGVFMSDNAEATPFDRPNLIVKEVVDIVACMELKYMRKQVVFLSTTAVSTSVTSVRNRAPQFVMVSHIKLPSGIHVYTTNDLKFRGLVHVGDPDESVAKVTFLKAMKVHVSEMYGTESSYAFFE
jgi:hypothetical protein